MFITIHDYRITYIHDIYCWSCVYTIYINVSTAVSWSWSLWQSRRLPTQIYSQGRFSALFFAKSTSESMVWYYLIRRTYRHTHTHRHAGDLESFIHFTQTDWQSGQARVVVGRGGEEGVSCVEYWGRHYQLEIRQKRTTTKQYTHAHGGLSVCV